MTILEALKNYHRDFGYWLHMCNDDEAEINFHTSGTPEFFSMDEALAYYKELGKLVEQMT